MRRQQRFAQHGCAAVLALTLSAVCALGQPAPLESRQVPINVDSGLTQNVPVVDLADAAAVEPLVVFVTEVSVPGASWLRLNFEQVLLSGDPAAGNASYLQITSVLDGAQQRLNADHVVVWSSTSAFFNGDTVFVELYAFAGTGANRLVMSEVTAGEP